ncbi:MAG: carbohydrate kinase family protein [Thermoplasmata archaeon]|nr:MAG: carbohydrate kinase family protein [Thermoplasmata archaeon]
MENIRLALNIDIRGTVISIIIQKVCVIMNTLIQKLIDKLEEAPSREFKIVVMPHFCIDNFIEYGGSYESFIEMFGKIAKQGGGNLTISQTFHMGGKAANCASALASLGIQTYLVARTNELGLKLMEYFTKEKNMDLTHVGALGKLAYTTTIELEGANVMISDPGSLSKFGPDYLSEEDIKLIREADIVYISDWGLNEKGTELAQYVFGFAKENKGCKTFFDPGDPSPKREREKEDIARLKQDVFDKGLVDIISLNLDELRRYGDLEYLRKVARVDLHTYRYARCYFKVEETEKIPTFNVTPKRLTGAGDAWNAGDIYGKVLESTPEESLLLANANAAYYISNSESRHPQRQDLIEFLKDKLTI